MNHWCSRCPVGCLNCYVLVLLLNWIPQFRMGVLGCTRLRQVRAVRAPSHTIHPFLGIYSLLQAAAVGTCLHTRTPCITIWSGILVLFWWIITVCSENSHSMELNPRILICRTIAEDGNLSCFSTLFLPWNWACDSMKWGAEKTEWKWCPEEKLSTDCVPICLEPGTLAILSCRH